MKQLNTLFHFSNAPSLGLFSAVWKVFILSFVILVYGCSGESRVEIGNKEGVLHLGNASEPQSLDPHVATGNSEHYIMDSLFEGLAKKNPYTLESEPGVAKSWDISSDGTTYTFHLRENSQWSNGDPVIAEDFRWSWERALTPALGSQNSYMLYPIKNAEEFFNGKLNDFSEVGVKVIDNYTLEVTLRAPTPYFLQLLDHQIAFPVHRPTIEAFGAYTDRLSRWALEGNLVGNGPFTLTDWKINSHVRVEKNQQYWDADTVKLNAIVFYPTENVITEERMFRDDQLHQTYDVPFDKAPVYIEQNPDLIVIAPYLGSYFYTINLTRKPFDDIRVRKALIMSIDRSLLNETVLQNLMEPSYALVPPGTLGYQPPQFYPYDPEQAKKLLAEAGYPNGDGFPDFEILYNTYENHRKIAVAIQQMWKKDLNINVNLINQEWRVYLSNQENMNYDVVRRGWIGDYVDPNTFLDMFITDGGNNRSGFTDPEYDDLILQQAPIKLDQEERFQLYYEAETVLMESAAVIPIYTYRSKHLKDPSFKGAPSNIMDYYNWKYVYLEASENAK